MNSNDYEPKIGDFIGIANIDKKAWLCCLYLNSGKMAVLYDSTESNPIIEPNFEKLLSLNVLDQNSLLKLFEKRQAKFIIDINESKSLSKCQFSNYKTNLFEFSRNHQLDTRQIITQIKYNFHVLSKLDEGDVVRFDRIKYKHDAILTGMIFMN
jgi:hypothetical protein